MYVVRITPPDGNPSFKAFSRRDEAVRWFEGALAVAAVEGIDAWVALFEAQGIDDPRSAIEAVTEGRAVILRNQGAAEQLDEG